jgi:hypothetical protein
VGEDLLDRHRVFDAGDDPYCRAAGWAGVDTDPEGPLEALRPTQLGVGIYASAIG